MNQVREPNRDLGSWQEEPLICPVCPVATTKRLELLMCIQII